MPPYFKDFLTQNNYSPFFKKNNQFIGYLVIRLWEEQPHQGVPIQRRKT